MIIKEIPYCDPVLLFEAIRSRPFSFFLDSGMDPERLGRYSLLGSDPFLVFRSKDGLVATHREGSWQEEQGDPFAALRELLNRYQTGQVAGLPVPVTAGAFGYFAYDLGRRLERLPELTVDDLKVPDCYLGFYDRLVVCDQLKKRAYLTSTGLPESGPAAAVRAGVRMRELEHLLAAVPQGSTREFPERPEPPRFNSSFTFETYCQAVQKIKDYIAAGDIFQANFTQRFSCPLTFSPWELYRRLRRINPAPFAAYLSYPELVVASASPERFLRVSNRVVETRPIKGTRPRGKSPAEDLRLRTELLNSTKDRAELTMIIDLERNDLGRVCSYGSVRVPELIVLETYPTVFHLVSTVQGTLAVDRDLVDLLRATFPGGSITGAPKVRAMEIIEELEPVRRGVYTGSIGYLGFDGTADLNIVIRTFVIKDGQAYFQVGGGIVADSDPELEYWETIHKGRALMYALGCREEAIPGCLGLSG